MATVGVLRQGKLFRVDGERARRNALSNIFLGLSSAEVERLYSVTAVRTDDVTGGVTCTDVPAQKLQALSLSDTPRPVINKKKFKHQNSVALIRNKLVCKD